MHEIKIRDLYTGKPDAKDEINFRKLQVQVGHLHSRN